MDQKKRLNWLEEEIDKIVERYKADAGRHKKVAFRLRILSVLLSAIITIFLGLKLENVSVSNVLSNIALILSAAITVVGAYEAFFDPRALWVRETITFARLKDLQRDFRFYSSGLEDGTIKIEDLDKFKSKLDSILEDTLKYWMKIKGAQDMAEALKSRADLKSGSGSTAEST